MMPAQPASIGSGVLPAGSYGYTRLCLLPLGLTAAFEGLAWLTGDFWLHLLAALALATLVAACVEDPRIKGLSVEVTAPLTATVGDDVHHRFTLTNNGRRSTSSCHLRSHAHGYADVSVLVPALAPGSQVTVDVPRRATDRVSVAGHVVVVTSTAPFGLRSVRCVHVVRAPLVVRPRLVPVPAPPLVTADTAGELGPGRLRRDGETIHGVRDWRSGDDARQIHWRTTARRGQLVVLERESPEQPRLVLVATGPSSAPSWEHSVSLLASTAVLALRSGASVAMYAEQAGLPTLSAATVDGALDWCAALVDPEWPSVGLLIDAARAAGPGGTVHLSTPGAFPPDVWATVSAYVAPYGAVAVPLPDAP